MKHDRPLNLEDIKELVYGLPLGSANRAKIINALDDARPCNAPKEGLTPGNYVLNEKLEYFKKFKDENPDVFDYIMQEIGYLKCTKKFIGPKQDGLVKLDESLVYEAITSNFDLNDSDTISNCAGTLARIICAQFGNTKQGCLVPLDQEEVYKFMTSFCLGLLDADKYKVLHKNTVPLLPSERRLFTEQFCAIFGTPPPSRVPSEVELEKEMHDTFLKFGVRKINPYDVNNIKRYATAIRQLLLKGRG